MTDLLTKVASTHLGRDAYVYVRQSTLTQMREHTESLERQYELADRAMTLGWAPRQVVIVDEDLGRSGAEATAREGFKNLVADVGFGKVGRLVSAARPVRADRHPQRAAIATVFRLFDELLHDPHGRQAPRCLDVLSFESAPSEGVWWT